MIGNIPYVTSANAPTPTEEEIEGLSITLSKVQIGLNEAAGTGLGRVGVGTANLTTGDYTTAVGVGAAARQTSATALGSLSNATKEYALSVGNAAQATGVSAVAVGDQVRSSATKSVAIGYKAVATGIESVAIGNVADADNAYCMALGSKCRTQGSSAICIGYDVRPNTTTGNSNSVGVGKDIRNPSYAIGIGQEIVGAPLGVFIGSSLSTVYPPEYQFGNIVIGTGLQYTSSHQTIIGGLESGAVFTPPPIAPNTFWITPDRIRARAIPGFATGALHYNTSTGELTVAT